MPKLPSDYSKTIIYKIININPDIKDCYVGHTTNFVKRKSYHKNDCMREDHKNFNFPLYLHIRENGGWTNFIMLEIEKYPCKDINEAIARERYHYEILKPNLNGVHPGLTKKESNKIYSQSHKEQIREKHREYAKINSEKIKEYQKNYKLANSEKIKEYQKNYKTEAKKRATKKPKDYDSEEDSD